MEKSKIFTIFAMSLHLIGVMGQSNIHNYVMKETMLSDDYIVKNTEVRYYNGVGTPVMSVTDALSGSGKFTYSMPSYDLLGRQTQTWLPVTTSNTTPSYVAPSEIPSLSELFHQDTHAYVLVSYDASDRLLEEWGAGETWHHAGRKKGTSYRFNHANEVRLYDAPTDGSCSLIKKGYYAKNRLSVTETSDEEGHSIQVFTDTQGRKVLERRNGNNDTYFVYNDLGQLRFVLSPGYQTEGHKAKYAYEYRYDDRGRIVKKILPGCQYIQYWYDSTDRLLFMQDGKLRAQGKYRFFLCDRLGRLAVQGTCTACNRGTYYAAVSFTQGTGGFCNTGYVLSKSGIVTSPELEIVNYYDTYGFMERLTPEEQDSLSFCPLAGYPTPETAAKGLPTGIVTYLMEKPSLYTIATTYYDGKGRPVCTRATNHLDGMDVMHVKYTFTGNPEKTWHRQSSSIDIGITEEYEFVYEHADRLQKTWYSLNGCNPIALSECSYDELGRIYTKTIGGTETVNFGYNIRNWPTAITSQKFAETLTYGGAEDGFTPTYPCFNGNISAIRWHVQGDTIQRGYQFHYDNLDRLTAAHYGEGTTIGNNEGRYDENATYDNMGNMVRFKRYGKADNGAYGTVDDLVISHDGNQIIKVTDHAEYDPTAKGAFHFSDGANESTEYSYDGNGNMTKDLNRGFTSVSYNNMNLPNLIVNGTNRYTRIVYDAAGRKLTSYSVTTAPLLWNEEEESASGASNAPRRARETMPKGFSDYIDYCANIVYDGENAIVLNPEGYAVIDQGGNATFHYYLRDHLGSNRVVFTPQDSIEQVNHYYAWGGLMDISSNEDAQRYRFCGKELLRDNGIDWYDHGARWYDATLPSWHTMDPLCESYYNISPFVYCAGNPIVFVDKDGKRPSANEAALMAAHVYEDKDADNYMNKLKDAGWTISDFNTSIKMEYSKFSQNGLKSELFQRTIDGATEYAYVFAGTNPLSIEDWVEDIAQVAGLSSQYNTAIYNAKTLSDELGDKELTFVGHSLGGGEAAASSMATGRAAITFNAAAVSGLTSYFHKLVNANNVTNYRAVGSKIGIGNIRIGGDILNNIQEKIGLKLPGTTISVPTGILPTHTIKDFLKYNLPEP